MADGLVFGWWFAASVAGAGKIAVTPWAALAHADASMLWLIQGIGSPDPHDDQLIDCTERTPLGNKDGTGFLRSFSKTMAIQVVNFWNCPKAILEWLGRAEDDRETVEVAMAPWVDEARAAVATRARIARGRRGTSGQSARRALQGATNASHATQSASATAHPDPWTAAYAAGTAAANAQPPWSDAINNIVVRQFNNEVQGWFNGP